eukprot:scaffold138262_cov14-Tisochrysis_lutea.AAC.1
MQALLCITQRPAAGREAVSCLDWRPLLFVTYNAKRAAERKTINCSDWRPFVPVDSNLQEGGEHLT